jgi:hypothetical protein
MITGVILLGVFWFPVAYAQERPAGGTGTATEEERVGLPGGETWLGTVRLPAPVLADGTSLPAGSYRVRLTGQMAEKDVPGQLETLERWVEFVQGNEVKARAMASVVPSSALKEVTSRTPPASGTVRVERLREDQYYRLWFNYKGDQILIHLPIA